MERGFRQLRGVNEMTLKELIEYDITHTFFKDDTGFNDTLYVGTSSENTRLCLGSLQANEVQNNSGNNYPLMQFSHILMIPFASIADIKIKAGNTIYINKTPYRIVSFNLEMGVYSIVLQNA